MAVTDHYSFWNLDPAEEMSAFPETWNFNIDKIDTAIHAAATDNVELSRLPNLPASKTTSGTFADARIPTTIARKSDIDKANRSTGVRDLSSSLNSQVSSGSVKVVRIGDTVTVSIDSVKFDGDGSYGYIILLPYGFRAMMTLRENLVSAEHGHQIATYTSGSVQCNRKPDYSIRNTFTFLTADDWPSTLPGDPA